MFYYKSEEDIKNIILQMNSRILLLEVKGDSVEHLFFIRNLLKSIFEGLENDEKIYEEVKEDGK